MPRLFALDQNFPEPIVNALERHLEDDVGLIPIRQIDGRLTTFDDWQILHALHAHEHPWDGLITTDSNMLRLPKEIAVLCQTKLTLVVAMASGHDPIRATGLVLAHIGHVCAKSDPNSPQVWRLGTSTKPAEDPWEFMTKAAEQRDTTATALYADERLSTSTLASDPLA